MLRDTLAQAAIFMNQHPEHAAHIVATTSELTGDTEVDVHAARHLIKVDESKTLGGGGTAPSPSQYALAALGSCLALTYRMWAEKLGVAVDHLDVDVHADIDARGVLGLGDVDRPGFSAVRVVVHISGPESAGRYEEVRAAAEAHCPVLDVFANPVPVTTTLDLVR